MNIKLKTVSEHDATKYTAPYKMRVIVSIWTLQPQFSFATIHGSFLIILLTL
jgi:hypothetical protein